MKMNMSRPMIAVAMLMLVANVLNAQLLDNDTLYIGSASGLGGEQVQIDCYIRTTQNYQGWQMPFRFGNGSSPVWCDSVSMMGTIMENWWFTAPFVNNNEWGGMQSCGVAGIVSMSGGSIPPGYYLALKLFFTIDSGASAGSISIDTTKSSWTPGGPSLGYVVVVGGNSYITHVVQGSITVIAPNVDEEISNRITTTFDVYPTIARAGDDIVINYAGSVNSSCRISIFDAAGRKVENIKGIYYQGEIRAEFNTSSLRRGVYFAVIDGEDDANAKKIIIY